MDGNAASRSFLLLPPLPLGDWGGPGVSLAAMGALGLSPRAR